MGATSGRRLLIAVWAFVLLWMCDSTAAQCTGTWLEGAGLNGADREVTATAMWDRDGDGPEPERLVVGGRFAVLGEARSNIVIWDGSRWQPLGGVHIGEIEALEVFDGELYVGGTRLVAGDLPQSSLLSWDGQQWHSICTEGNVRALRVYKGRLYAGGYGFALYNADLISIGSWDGTSWSDVGGGITLMYGPTVTSLEVYADDLIVGGSFGKVGTTYARGIARWDGIAWHALGEGLNAVQAPPVVTDTAMYMGQLYAVGQFTNSAGRQMRGVARWDGAEWWPVGGDTTFPGFADAVCVYNNELYIGGNFSSIGNVSVSRIARWDGSTWKKLGNGTTVQSGNVEELRVYNSKLFVGGEFVMSANGQANAAYWNGSSFSAVVATFDQHVRTAMEHENGFLVGGAFSTTPAGLTRGLVQWDGERWKAFGTTLSIGAVVDAMIMHDAQPLIAGLFSAQKAGGGVVRNVATWNGTSWTAVGGEFDGRVRCLGWHKGMLIAGGDFTSCGGVPMSSIAQWNGSVWQPLGNGFEHAEVWDIQTYNGDLYAGGRFTNSGTKSIPHLARWDGTTWHTVGAALNNAVYELSEHGGKLLIGGEFTNSGRPYLCTWDGSVIQGVPGTSQLNGSVHSILQFGTDVLLGGWFTSFGPTSVKAIGRFDGSTVAPFTSGLVAQHNGFAGAYSLVMANGELVACGEFVGPESNVSCRVARWSATGAPSYLEQPQDASSCGGPMVLEAVPVAGYSDAVYEWRREGEQVEDVPGRIYGSSTTLLTITNPIATDAGSYVCVAVGDCGESLSEPATVSVCRADFDCTGFVDTDDFDAYVRAFEAGTENADVDGTGFVDTDDFDTFVRAFEAGC